MKNEYSKIIVGHTYLCGKKYTSQPQIFQVETLIVSDSAYHFKYESGNLIWEDKVSFHDKYDIIEDITKFLSGIVIPYTEEMGVPNYVLCPPCPHCNGTGMKPNLSSSSGYIICPYCNGSKVDGYRFNKTYTRFEPMIDYSKKL